MILNNISTWRDIQDIFGDGSDYAYALKSSGNNAELYDFEEPEEKPEIKLTDLYEPAEIAEKLLTEEDEIIRIKDVPERFQVCVVCVFVIETSCLLICLRMMK